MTIESEMDDLLGEVLALQDEDGRGAELTEERVRHVLLGRDAFTSEEERVLAMSPLARLTYAEALEDLRLEREAFRQRCKMADVRTTTADSRLAAEDGGPDLTLRSKDFSVTARPHPLSQGWVITLTLGAEFRQIVRSDDVLALVDDRNDTWLRGQVNCYGEIHSYDWPYDETPVARMRRGKLALHVQYG